MVQPTTPTRRQQERQPELRAPGGGGAGYKPERLTWSEIGSEKWAAQQRNGSTNILADVVADMTPEMDVFEQLAPKQRALLAAHDALRSDINHHGIARVPVGSHELPAYEGRGFYDWQFYLRAPLLKPSNLNYIAVYFWSMFLAKFKQQPFQLCGVEAASVPIITALLLGGKGNGLDVSAFTIRKERKEYGLRNVIEGTPTNQPVLYVDDLTAPEHKTIWYAINQLAQLRLKLYPHAFVVVFKGYKNPPADSPLQLARTPGELATSIGTTRICSMFTLDDFDMTLAEYVQKKSR